MLSIFSTPLKVKRSQKRFIIARVPNLRSYLEIIQSKIIAKYYIIDQYHYHAHVCNNRGRNTHSHQSHNTKDKPPITTRNKIENLPQIPFQTTVSVSPNISTDFDPFAPFQNSVKETPSQEAITTTTTTTSRTFDSFDSHRCDR